MPIVVSCEPGQRTIVKPTIVNGVAMSQVECVAAEIAQPAFSPQPVAHRAYAQPVAYAQPLVQSPSPSPIATPVVARTTTPPQVVREVADTEVVPVSRPSVVRPVVRDKPSTTSRGLQRRTVKKSAIIIGSSSGVGAGVGAAVGGKKGALIGAVIGGGGAALWDQVTRRKN